MSQCLSAYLLSSLMGLVATVGCKAQVECWCHQGTFFGLIGWGWFLWLVSWLVLV